MAADEECEEEREEGEADGGGGVKDIRMLLLGASGEGVGDGCCSGRRQRQ